ncbi:MAG: serine hydrolase [Acidobacteria bacterium]|nr:serine hydrolase [Acidobacteriota bacterium]
MTMLRRSAVLALAGAIGCGAAMDAARLKRIPALLRASAENGGISGAVVLVARHGKVELLDAAGFRDVESRKPMRVDTIVQVMSQTKPVTAVAAMMLVEEGKLDLARPVADYLPEFKGQMVEEKRADGSVNRHPPARPPTVGQLLSHTAGLPFLPAHELSRVNFTLDVTLKEAIAVYGREPMVSEPGTKHLYRNMGIATVGRLIEVLSGEEYTEFIGRRLLGPLGMKDSFFFPVEGKKSRIAMVYTHENGKLTRRSFARARAIRDRNWGCTPRLQTCCGFIRCWRTEERTRAGVTWPRSRCRR